MDCMEIKILDDRIGSTIPLPCYTTLMAAGLDLAACIDAPMTLAPQQCALISTGLAIYIKDPGYMGLILPRSGLGHKHGLVLGNGSGVIDADYQGELRVSCFNRSQTPYTIEEGDRIAQLIIQPIARPNFVIVSEFTEQQKRIKTGFGSTGVKAIFPQDDVVQ